MVARADPRNTQLRGATAQRCPPEPQASHRTWSGLGFLICTMGPVAPISRTVKRTEELLLQTQSARATRGPLWTINNRHQSPSLLLLRFHRLLTSFTQRGAHSAFLLLQAAPQAPKAKILIPLLLGRRGALFSGFLALQRASNDSCKGDKTGQKEMLRAPFAFYSTGHQTRGRFCLGGLE